MPIRPPKPCSKHGCPALVPVGQSFCSDHAALAAQLYDKQRGSAASRGYGTRWKRYRLSYLARNPLCVECLPRVVQAKVVDHIVPHRGDKKVFWDKSNHQGLCKHHHDVKTATEDGGFGNREGVAQR